MKVLFHEHIFDECPKEYEVDGNTWGEIIKELGIKGHLSIFDNGKELSYPECHDLKPEMDTVRIMRRPDDKATSYIVAGVLTVAGAILTFTGIGASVGVPLMVSGITMAVGTMLIEPMPETKALEDYSGGYNINGSTNANAIGNVPPLVLGECMIKPPVCGLQVTRVEGSGINAKQYVKFLYCLGYRGEGSLVTNIRIGDTVFASNSAGVFNGEIEVDGGLVGKCEIRQDGSLPALYNTLSKETQVGSELKKFAEMEKVYYTSTYGCDRVTLSIVFQGLYRMKDDGGLDYCSEAIRVYMRPAGSDKPWVQVSNDLTYTGNRNKQYIYTAVVEPTQQMVVENPNKQWDVLVCKVGIANDTDSKVNAKPHLGFIQFNTSREPVVSPMKEKVIFLACEFEASAELQSRIGELSCIVKNKYHVYDEENDNWDKVDYSSNPAVLYLDILKGNYLPYKAKDRQIDYPKLVELYKWCEENKRTCNAVISNQLQVRELLNNILFTCQGSFYLKNGLYSVSFDRVQPSPVALLIPKNTSDFKGSKVFGNKIDAIECTFADKNADYKTTTEIIMPYGKTSFSNKKSVEMFGTDNFEQAVKIARYMMACNEQRPETYSLTMGIEHFSIPRGSRVLVQHDVLKVGITSGRIENIKKVDDNNWAITIDEIVDIGIPEEEYCLTIFKADGDMITIPVETPIDGTSVLNAFAEPVGVQVGDLYAYGIMGTETIDCLVDTKKVLDDMRCELTLIGYAHSVFSATDTEVPPYNPKVYRGSVFYQGGGVSNPDELDDYLKISHFGNIFFDFGVYAQKDN